MEHVLIIQTSYLGDVVLATSLAESLHQKWPQAKIDFLVKKGNESLFDNHPFLNRVFVFDKQKSKLLSLFRVSSELRKNKYDLAINLHRFGSSGLITWLSGAVEKRGFSKNPFSFLYTRSFPHEISAQGKVHEIKRNHVLIEDIVGTTPSLPKLYPRHFSMVAADHHLSTSGYYCIAPASVWFTKQFPAEKWSSFISLLPIGKTVYLLGSPADLALCESIREMVEETRRNTVVILSGRSSLLDTAAIMNGAIRNFVNDSAPLHLASSMNSPVTAIFCSTTPNFGFGPLSDDSKTVEYSEHLSCKPCGIHGRRTCPQAHFRCGKDIDLKSLL